MSSNANGDIPAINFTGMSDSQLRQTITQLSTAANLGGQYQQAPASGPAAPTPQQSTRPFSLSLSHSACSSPTGAN